ncbi:MAG: hypothetical protein SWL02_09990 [Pseudomonadota bacterium]|nr:hypothetical protein [Pseudomonadota bacterium]
MATNKPLLVIKASSIPVTWLPDAIYAIQVTAEQAEMYVTDSGGLPRKIFAEAEVQALIDQAINDFGSSLVVADIVARDALTAEEGDRVHVVDATADSSVDGGTAGYIYDGSDWIKMYEQESLDIDFSAISISWSQLTGAPSSTPAQIDQSVTDSHTHSNKTELDKIGEDGDGNLTYNGTSVKTFWEQTSW